MASDMPYTTDSHRVLRLALVIDEVARNAQLYRKGDFHKIRQFIDELEFKACGGKPSKVDMQPHQFYRQLVYAKRDADAYSIRGCFPKAGAVQKAAQKYLFYDSDNEDEISEQARMSIKDAHAMHRIAVVLKRFRKFARDRHLATQDAMNDFMLISLSKEEFVRCGGHRSTAGSKFSFFRQIKQIKQDIQRVFERGRFKNSKALASMPDQISSGEEEDVDLHVSHECADEDMGEEQAKESDEEEEEYDGEEDES